MRREDPARDLEKKMKFEEVLPLMRDKGRIGSRIVGGSTALYRLQQGELQINSPSNNSGWRNTSFSDTAFTTDNWSLQPEEEETWTWVFGFGDQYQHWVKELTESEADQYMFNNNFGWKVKLEPTRKLVQREEK